MSEVEIVALLSLIGSLAGSFGGILAANKLTNFRIERLEKEVSEVNKLTGRVYELEKHNTVQDKSIENLVLEQGRIIDDIRHLKRGT